MTNNAERARAWRKNNPEKSAVRDKLRNPKVVDRLRLKNGWSVERFNEFVILQDGKCPICNSELEFEYGRHGQHKAHADHNHLTGSPRGILCRKCNVSLGGFNDSKDLLAAAIRYLERWT